MTLNHLPGCVASKWQTRVQLRPSESESPSHCTTRAGGQQLVLKTYILADIMARWLSKDLKPDLQASGSSKAPCVPNLSRPKVSVSSHQEWTVHAREFCMLSSNPVVCLEQTSPRSMTGNRVLGSVTDEKAAIQSQAPETQGASDVPALAPEPLGPGLGYQTWV